MGSVPEDRAAPGSTRCTLRRAALRFRVKFARSAQMRSHYAVHLSDAVTNSKTLAAVLRIALDQKVEGSNPSSPATLCITDFLCGAIPIVRPCRPALISTLRSMPQRQHCSDRVPQMGPRSSGTTCIDVAAGERSARSTCWTLPDVTTSAASWRPSCLTAPSLLSIPGRRNAFHHDFA